MSIFNKLGSFLKNTTEYAKIINDEFSITDRLYSKFAKAGVNPRLSKPVRDIIEILDNLNIRYETEKSFSDCRNKNALPFDFCIYTKDDFFLVEYDGLQHQKPCFGLSEDEKMEKFLDTRNNDIIRDQYCMEHGITLYRISYTENHVQRIMNILKENSLI